MKKARIAELKNNLSRYLEHVRGGGSVLVPDRDRPVAQLVPLTRTPSGTGEGRERLARLERRGLIRTEISGRGAAGSATILTLSSGRSRESSCSPRSRVDVAQSPGRRDGFASRGGSS